MITEGRVRILAAFLALFCPLALAAQDAGKRLHELLEADWEYGLEQSPLSASYLGDRRWNDKWDDISQPAMLARYEHDRRSLETLLAISREQLSPADRVTYDMYRQQLGNSLADFEFGAHLIPVNQRGGIQTADEIALSLRFATLKDFEDWITRLRTFPVVVDQTITLMRAGLKRGIKHPRLIMERIPAQIDKQFVEPEKSGFYHPFKEFPASIAEADRARLSRDAKAAIAEQVIPAYRRFHEFFVKEYIPSSYDQIGVWQWPDGDKYYKFVTQRYTTTTLTPDEIHEIGLKEVARIRAAMEAIKEKTGFKGTLAEFFHFLRTDPRFYYKTPDELLDAYRAVSKRIDPTLVKLFRTMPRMPYGVQPIPEASAPDTTAAYYNQPAADGSRAGFYFVNLYKVDSRPKWEMMALSLHEAVPGHHFQIALSMEVGELPKFRRYGYYSAYGEGWALYAESLGDELGLYDDPYSKFGQLTYEMWRAVRLVVDTGMHQKKWTRDRAIRYFMDNAAKTELDVVNEIDRYIVWPGQALSYKIGELTIKRLRAKAATALGDRFDIREFHDVVLLQGAVPLTILENAVDEWIAKKQAAMKKP